MIPDKPRIPRPNIWHWPLMLHCRTAAATGWVKPGMTLTLAISTSGALNKAPRI